MEIYKKNKVIPDMGGGRIKGNDGGGRINYDVL
jgi:hypothetical protein